MTTFLFLSVFQGKLIQWTDPVFSSLPVQCSLYVHSILLYSLSTVFFPFSCSLPTNPSLKHLLKKIPFISPLYMPKQSQHPLLLLLSETIALMVPFHIRSSNVTFLTALKHLNSMASSLLKCLSSVTHVWSIQTGWSDKHKRQGPAPKLGFFI